MDTLCHCRTALVAAQAPEATPDTSPLLAPAAVDSPAPDQQQLVEVMQIIDDRTPPALLEPSPSPSPDNVAVIAPAPEPEPEPEPQPMPAPDATPSPSATTSPAPDATPSPSATTSPVPNTSVTDAPAADSPEAADSLEAADSPQAEDSPEAADSLEVAEPTASPPSRPPPSRPPATQQIVATGNCFIDGINSRGLTTFVAAVNMSGLAASGFWSKRKVGAAVGVDYAASPALARPACHRPREEHRAAACRAGAAAANEGHQPTHLAE
jgi:hypothetical protein